MKLIKSKKYQNVYSYKTQKGTFYTVRFVYYDLQGKRREKQIRGFASELEAHKAELDLEIKYANGDTREIDESSLTVAQWVERYSAMNQRNWRPNTKRVYEGCFKNYLIPTLGNCPLQKLTRAKYESLFIAPQFKKLSPASIRDNHRTVMALLNSAVDYEVLDKNRLSRVKLPKPNTRVAFEPGDLKKFNQALLSLNYNYQVFFRLLELTGMRRGEAMALTWEDVNLEKCEISIRKSRSDFGTGPTKTSSSNRTIAIDKSLSQLLKHYRLYQKQKCLRLATSFKESHVIFTSKLNNAIGTQAISYNFKRAIDLANIKSGKYVVHSLRHTHATYLLDLGVSPADVAKRLGHSNASITLSIYAHSIKSNDKIIAEKVAKLAEM